MMILKVFAVIAALSQPAQNAGLRIVVIAGEDSINVIQQKTAVAPIVEVRDRNNVPVVGAVVSFTIDGGGKVAAFAGAGPTFTVTTNAAGQAAAAAINPIGNGAFHIQVQAVFQGQTAAATIAQTNVATAAQAASAASGAGGGGGGGTAGAAGGAGAGGGVSATTIGVIAGVAGGGAVAATTIARKSDEATSGDTTVSGALSGQMANTITNDSGLPPCINTRAIAGTMTINYKVKGNVFKGGLKTTGTDTLVASSCGGTGFTTSFERGGEVTGTATDVRYHREETGPPATVNGVTATTTTVTDFTGTLSGGVITGTFSETQSAVFSSPGGPGRSTASVTMTVTLR